MIIAKQTIAIIAKADYLEENRLPATFVWLAARLVQPRGWGFVQGVVHSLLPGNRPTMLSKSTVMSRWE